MKKILLFTNLVLLSFLLFSYSENRILQTTIDQNIKLGVHPLLAKNLASRYKTDIWGTRKIQNKYSMDARSVWFSITKLKAFIQDIETSSTGCAYSTDSFKLGIRFYFSAYPDSGTWNNYGSYFTDHKIPKSYGGLHTLLMVPTIWNPADSFNYDFDPRKYDAAGNPIAVKDVMDVLLNPTNQTPQFRLPVKPIPSIVPTELAYALTADNLDNMKFLNTPGSNTNTLLRSMNSPDANDAYFTNGGTLIPPPYPPSANGTDQRILKNQQTFFIPYSGASFMRWADGTNKCGWNTVSLNNIASDPIKKSGTFTQ